MRLRPYQEKIVDETRYLMKRGFRSVLIQSPTGSGKTLLTAHMLGSAADRQMASWFIVHRRELINQSTNAFTGEGIKHGIISAQYPMDKREHVQIASVQTLIRRYQKFRVPNLIVWDECHHIAANSWSKIFDAFPNSFHIGLTATPERLDGTGLKRWFRAMVKGPSVQWLIENGFLSKYKLYAPSEPDTSRVRTRMGDFVGSELTQVVDRPSITGDAIKHYNDLAPNKRAVVFCASVQHSKNVVDQFIASGIQAMHVDGTTPTIVRDDAIKRFREGRLKVLSNVDLFGEGFDVPGIEAAILLRPTRSLGLFLQQVGRSLRPADGKETAIILDHAGNCQRHGLPDDDREWTLAGRPKRRKSAPPAPIRICSVCYAAQNATRRTCSQCGHEFEIQSRQIEEKEGELKEVDVKAARRARLREQGQAKTLEQLIALGKQRGYKSPFWWAQNVMKCRKAKGAHSAI